MILKKFGSALTDFASLAIVVALISLVGCGQAATETADHSAAVNNSRSTPSRTEQEEDRGNARFTLAGDAWVGTRASARLKKDRLRISASNSARAGEKVKTGQLKLNMSDYKGPGRYKSDGMSMFIEVNFDVPDDKDDQAAAKKTLMDALGNTNHITLTNADIEITSDSDGFIDGTFAMEKSANTPESTITDGQFHARIRK